MRNINLTNTGHYGVSVTSSNTARVSVSKQLVYSIKLEHAVFENSDTRGRCLEQVYAYLLTIPATSVQTEVH